MCLFCEIAVRNIPSKVEFEDDAVFAFDDIAPQAPVHILIIPKKHIEDAQALTPADGELLMRLFETAQLLAKKYKLDESGYRLITNVGKDAGQTVPHLHLHLIGGKTMNWNN